MQNHSISMNGNHCRSYFYHVRTGNWYGPLQHWKWYIPWPEKNQHLFFPFRKYSKTDRQRSNWFKEKKIPYQIIEVGFYEPQDYQKLLDQSLLTLFISHSETQGLAMFESWSMNVPTFHWDPEFMNYYGTPYPESSSAPYLTKDLGSSFKDFEDFKNKFSDFYENCHQLQPRKIILEKYTNSHSADLFISILNQHLN